jgi:8-oxo-dGTP pyrophosphatase MutT (NUDIX family)
MLAVAIPAAVAVALVGWTLARGPRGARKWISAGGVVIDGRGRVAIVRQRDRKGRWRWTLPKGRIDVGESAAEAALREVYEESGLRARIVRPIGLHEGRLHFTQYFEMVLLSDDGVHDRETKEVRLASFAEAVALLRARRDRQVLRALVRAHTRVVTTD